MLDTSSVDVPNASLQRRILARIMSASLVHMKRVGA
jgi:hypothetical protein